MNQPDWNRVRAAVERVIAKHEQRIRNQKLKVERAALRSIQKAICIAETAARAANAPGLAGACIAAVLPKIASTPASVFQTDRPEVDPLRARALKRLRCWGKPKPQSICQPSAAEVASALKAAGPAIREAASSAKNFQKVWIEIGDKSG